MLCVFFLFGGGVEVSGWWKTCGRLGPLDWMSTQMGWNDRDRRTTRGGTGERVTGSVVG
jgi:hypothetical protein